MEIAVYALVVLRTFQAGLPYLHTHGAVVPRSLFSTDMSVLDTVTETVATCLTVKEVLSTSNSVREKHFNMQCGGNTVIWTL